GLDSENSDPLFIRRDSPVIDVSSLEISVGETATIGEVKWAVGFTTADDLALLTAKAQAVDKINEWHSDFLDKLENDPTNVTLGSTTATFPPFSVSILYDNNTNTSSIYNYDGVSVPYNAGDTTYGDGLTSTQLEQLNTNLESWKTAQIAALETQYNTSIGTMLADPSAPKIFRPVLQMRSATLPDPDTPGAYLPPAGFVGIMDPMALVTENESFKPETLLHLKSKVDGSDTSVSVNHMVVFESTSNIGLEATANIHTLAINYTSISPDDQSNFMTFGIGSTDPGTFPNQIQSLGAIEGNGGQEAPGVAFSSPERDYAEYILKKNPDEEINPGDIVGLYGGKASKSTKGAENLMVISSSPIIVGNWQPTHDLNHYALVAFLGQVPVKVRGKVNKGDYIVPSGDGDGAGIAISPSDLTFNNIDKIVGKAWESSDEEALKLVRASVGFPFAKQATYSRQTKVRLAVASLKQENTNLKESLSKKIVDREKQIKRLKQLVREL
ncbi:hypothetical protein DID80_05515, partial [Candidatus Marinamargulisbacteria bacterium SCGC AAA071-K20]